MAIHYLHEHAIDAINFQRPSLLETDFKYVVTVPAIWDIRAKCFMREAAKMVVMIWLTNCLYAITTCDKQPPFNTSNNTPRTKPNCI